MRKVAIALLLIAGLATPAMADQVKLLQGPYPGGTGGGEFTVQVYDNPAWLDLTDYDVKTKNLLAEPVPTFQTFCIDEQESIALNGIYNAIVNTDAVKGGEATSDPLSVGTGYLYSQFAGGTLVGYAYSGEARKTSARDLQDALWYLEGTQGQTINAFYTNLLTNIFGSLENAMKDGGWKYGVYALNLTDARGAYAQDVLYYAPDGGATLMLLGGALIGLGALRRKLGR